MQRNVLQIKQIPLSFRQEEVEAGEQGPVHPEDVPQGRLGHPRPQEPARLGGRQRTRHPVEQESERKNVLSGKREEKQKYRRRLISRENE